MNTVPLAPTEEDLQFLATTISQADRREIEDVRHNLNCAYIAKYPKYMTGGPGFCGTVFSIVWDGGPEFVSVVTVAQGNVGVAHGELTFSD